MSKKFLAKLLIFCMVFTMLPFTAFAADDVTSVQNANKDAYTIAWDTATNKLAQVKQGAEVEVKANLTYANAPDTTDVVNYTAVAGSQNLTVSNGKFTVPETMAVGTTITVTAKATVDGNKALSISKDLTVVAANTTVTIKFDVNGGVGTYDPVTINKGGTVTLPEENPTREGYIFNGWFTEKDGGKEVTAVTTFDKDTTIYAQWVEVKMENADLAPSAVTVEPAPTVTDPEEQAVLNAAVTALENATAPVVSGLDAVVAAVAEDAGNGIKVAGTEVTEQQINAAKTALNTKLGEEVEAKTVVVPTINIKLKENGTATKLTFSIVPQAVVWVTSEATNNDEINADNSVMVGNPIVITVVKPVTIVLPLPDGFYASLTMANPVVKHDKGEDVVYYHKTTKVETSKSLRFENRYGFSDFTVDTEFEAVAEIGDMVYASLQEAVDAVGNNGTITLLKDITEKETITVSRVVTFDVTVGAFIANFEIKAGSGYKLGTGNDPATHHYVIESNGGGSGAGSSSNVSIATKVIGGTVTYSPAHPSKGQTVTITVKPAEGYKLDTMVVTDRDGKTVELTKVDDTHYTFVMPAGKVTITPTFVKADDEKKVETPTFSDVKDGDWFAKYVAYVVEKGMMKGYEDGRFGPNDYTTRAQIVTVLYRLEGEPDTSSASFSDVSGGQYYSDPVAWAANNGIVKGYETGKFGPSDNVTREQIAAILYRYAEYKNIDTSAAGDITTFSDAASVSDWANDAIAWAVAEGLMNGDNGALRPQGNATRAEIAAMLMRFCENVLK